MSCLILPDLTVENVERFNEAIFAEAIPSDCYEHIRKVFCLLDVQPSAAVMANYEDSDDEEESFSSINYKRIFDQADQKQKVFQSLGYLFDGRDKENEEPLASIDCCIEKIPVLSLFGEAKVECQFCKRRFYSEDNLHRHMKLLHR